MCRLPVSALTWLPSGRYFWFHICTLVTIRQYCIPCLRFPWGWPCKSRNMWEAHRKVTNGSLLLIVCFWRDSPPVGQDVLVFKVSRSHNDTPQSVGLLWTSDSSSQRPLPDNTQQTNVHAPGGIQTHNLSRRAAADLLLRTRGHWDRLIVNCAVV